MTSLFTQCPHCQTSFRVSNAQLNAAHGLVRCGSCLGVFSASANEIRVKHPDGYIVEELDAADSVDESEAQVPAAEFCPPGEPVFTAADSEGLTEPLAATPSAAQPDEPEDDEAIWHRPGEPYFAFGDLSLDELENDYQEAPSELSADASQELTFVDDTQEVAEFDDEVSSGAFVEEYSDEAVTDTEEFDAEFDEEYHEDSDEEIPADFEEHFSADRGETGPAMPAAPRLANLPADKQAVRAKLGSLNFDDALDPVSEYELDALEAVPVMLVHSTSFRSRAVTALLLVANVLLMLALPLPWFYTHRNELATHPRFSFLAEPVCRYLTCAQPPVTVPASLYSQQLLVRSHPKAPEALEVSFVFHNDAKQAQDFPKLALDFSDISNHVLSNRLFTPDEYLPPELRHLRQMPAQSTVQIQLELVDPGKEAVNYKIELFPL